MTYYLKINFKIKIKICNISRVNLSFIYLRTRQIATLHAYNHQILVTIVLSVSQFLLSSPSTFQINCLTLCEKIVQDRAKNQHFFFFTILMS